MVDWDTPPASARAERESRRRLQAAALREKGVCLGWTSSRKAESRLKVLDNSCPRFSTPVWFWDPQVESPALQCIENPPSLLQVFSSSRRTSPLFLFPLGVQGSLAQAFQSWLFHCSLQQPLRTQGALTSVYRLVGMNDLAG